MSIVENYLPLLVLDGQPSGDEVSGVQIGQIIIHPDDVWHNSYDEPVYDLLDTGSTFLAEEYPELAVLYPSLTLDAVPDAEGSPFPYKYVADYTGG